MISRIRMMRGVSVGALILVLGASSASAQQNLPRIDVGNRPRDVGGAAPRQSTPRALPAQQAGDGAPTTIAAPGFEPARAKLPIYRDPPGQTFTSLKHNFLETTPMSTVQEFLRYSPGVTFQETGAPTYDFVINIRGSGNRLNQHTRNIQMYEDGFPIMTADGFGRTDMLDPHSFSGVDVYRGPSSALFGNYAYGGAVNFRSFSGAEIDGVEYGSEFGSFGYFNNYLRGGKKVSGQAFGEADLSVFASDTRNDGYIGHTAGDRQNATVLLKLTPTPTDRLILKLIYNNTFSQMQVRQSLNQYFYNPYVKNYGCATPTAGNVPFCNNLNTYANGIYGPTIRQSPNQLGYHHNIQREIAGLRWEHDFDDATTWRSQFTYDYLENKSATWMPLKIIGGTGGPVYMNGPTVGISASTDITRRASLFGFPTTSYLGFFYDNLKLTNPTYAWVPNVWSYGMPGGPTGKMDSYHSNISLRAREEIALRPDLTAVIGFSSNWNRVWGVNSVYNYSGRGAVQTPTQVGIDNDYWNTAPEASLTWRYNPEWQLRARYAAGYGTPNFSYLTATVNGVGNNGTMKAQTNMGVDLGVDWTPTRDLTVGVTAFHEWFRNEIMQLTAPSLVFYWFNIPQSVHRGVEVSADWRPIDGAQFLLAYTYNNQQFTNFMDPLSATVYYNRSGKAIPNVAPHSLTARAGYDIPYGQFAGLGGYVEYIYKSDYALDNANLAWAPGYGLFNLNLHYSRDIAQSWLKRFDIFFDVKNVTDRTYVAGAAVMTDGLIGRTGIQQDAALLSTNTGASVIAGQPRAFIGGVKFKF